MAVDDQPRKVSPPVARYRVARRLREMRHTARLSGDVAAERLDLTRSSLNRLETGATRADVHIARTAMDVYDQYSDDLLDLVRDSRRKGWWAGLNVGDPDYVAWETNARVVRELAVMRLPDLVQTDEYARALRIDLEPPRLTGELAALRIRQRRLTDLHEPMALTAVIDEATLRRQVGELSTMRAQLDHLADRAQVDTVTIRVLPAAVRAPTAVSGGFIVLEPADPQDPMLLHISCPSGSVRDDRLAAVAAAQRVFAQAESAALSCEESVKFIRQVRHTTNPVT